VLPTAHLSAELLPHAVAGDPAWGDTPSERLCPDELGVGERVVTEPGGNGEGPLPVLRCDELLE